MNKVIQCLWGETLFLRMFCASLPLAGHASHWAGRLRLPAWAPRLNPASSNGAGQPLAALERPGNRVRQAYGAPCPGNERIPPGLRTVDEALGGTRIAPGQAPASRTADCRPRLALYIIFCSRISPGSYLLFLLFKLVVVDKECGHLWTGVDSSFATSTWRSPVHVRSPASGVSRALEQLHSPPGFCG
jgi:hypothetical protein